MRAKFDSASNYAAFIHDGMQRPSEGGRFYALLAYNRCDELNSVDPAQPAHKNARPDLYERASKKIRALKASCAGVKAQFPDHVTFTRALKSTNSKGEADALLLESSALMTPKRETSLLDIERAKKSRDPYLLAATLDMNVEFIAERIDPAFAQGGNRTALFMASAAAACEIIGNCRDNLRVHVACVSGDSCQHDDLRDFLRANLGEELRPLYDKTRVALVRSVGR